MAQTIEVAKAAHLLGIKRSQLQKLIKSGDLQNFEGKIDVEELTACFPSIALLDNKLETELEYIKKAAFSNRVQDVVLPNKEDLGSQLQKARVKLSIEQQKATRYLEIIQGLLLHIAKLRGESGDSEKVAIDEISQWILQQMDNL